MSLASSTRRLRSQRVKLPWDCLLLVFRECDKRTLATLGRVSLDILAATAPLLYRRVEIKSVQALQQLFCERPQPKKFQKPSRVNSLLSLGQIETLSFELSDDAHEAHLVVVPPMSLHRSPGAGVLPLLELRIIISNRDPDEDYDDVVYTALYDNLLAALDPVRLYWSGQIHSIWTPMRGSSGSLSWQRISFVDLQNSVPYENYGDYNILGLPFASSAPQRIIRFHIETFDYFFEDVEEFLDYLGNGNLGLHAMTSGSVVLVVTSDASKARAEQAIQSNVAERNKALFRVEVET